MSKPAIELDPISEEESSGSGGNGVPTKPPQLAPPSTGASAIVEPVAPRIVVAESESESESESDGAVSGATETGGGRKMSLSVAVSARGRRGSHSHRRRRGSTITSLHSSVTAATAFQHHVEDTATRMTVVGSGYQSPASMHAADACAVFLDFDTIATLIPEHHPDHVAANADEEGGGASGAADKSAGGAGGGEGGGEGVVQQSNTMSLEDQRKLREKKRTKKEKRLLWAGLFFCGVMCLLGLLFYTRVNPINRPPIPPPDTLVLDPASTRGFCYSDVLTFLGSGYWLNELTLAFAPPNEPVPLIVDLKLTFVSSVTTSFVPAVSHTFTFGARSFVLDHEKWLDIVYRVLSLGNLRTNRKAVQVFIDVDEVATDYGSDCPVADAEAFYKVPVNKTAYEDQALLQRLAEIAFGAVELVENRPITPSVACYVGAVPDGEFNSLDRRVCYERVSSGPKFPQHVRQITLWRPPYLEVFSLLAAFLLAVLLLDRTWLLLFQAVEAVSIGETPVLMTPTDAPSFQVLGIMLVTNFGRFVALFGPILILGFFDFSFIGSYVTLVGVLVMFILVTTVDLFVFIRHPDARPVQLILSKYAFKGNATFFDLFRILVIFALALYYGAGLPLIGLAALLHPLPTQIRLLSTLSLTSYVLLFVGNLFRKIHDGSPYPVEEHAYQNLVDLYHGPRLTSKHLVQMNKVLDAIKAASDAALGGQELAGGAMTAKRRFYNFVLTMGFFTLEAHKLDSVARQRFVPDGKVYGFPFLPSRIEEVYLSTVDDEHAVAGGPTHHVLWSGRETLYAYYKEPGVSLLTLRPGALPDIESAYLAAQRTYRLSLLSSFILPLMEFALLIIVIVYASIIFDGLQLSEGTSAPFSVLLFIVTILRALLLGSQVQSTATGLETADDESLDDLATAFAHVFRKELQTRENGRERAQARHAQFLATKTLREADEMLAMPNDSSARQRKFGAFFILVVLVVIGGVLLGVVAFRNQSSSVATDAEQLGSSFAQLENESICYSEMMEFMSAPLWTSLLRGAMYPIDEPMPLFVDVEWEWVSYSDPSVSPNEVQRWRIGSRSMFVSFTRWDEVAAFLLTGSVFRTNAKSLYINLDEAELESQLDADCNAAMLTALYKGPSSEARTRFAAYMFGQLIALGEDFVASAICPLTPDGKLPIDAECYRRVTVEASPQSIQRFHPDNTARSLVYLASLVTAILLALAVFYFWDSFVGLVASMSASESLTGSSALFEEDPRYWYVHNAKMMGVVAMPLLAVTVQSSRLYFFSLLLGLFVFVAFQALVPRHMLDPRRDGESVASVHSRIIMGRWSSYATSTDGRTYGFKLVYVAMYVIRTSIACMVGMVYGGGIPYFVLSFILHPARTERYLLVAVVVTVVYIFAVNWVVSLVWTSSVLFEVYEQFSISFAMGKPSHHAMAQLQLFARATEEFFPLTGSDVETIKRLLGFYLETTATVKYYSGRLKTDGIGIPDFPLLPDDVLDRELDDNGIVCIRSKGGAQSAFKLTDRPVDAGSESSGLLPTYAPRPEDEPMFHVELTDQGVAQLDDLFDTRATGSYSIIQIPRSISLGTALFLAAFFALIIPALLNVVNLDKDQSILSTFGTLIVGFSALLGVALKSDGSSERNSLILEELEDVVTTELDAHGIARTEELDQLAVNQFIIVYDGLGLVLAQVPAVDIDFPDADADADDVALPAINVVVDDGDNDA